MFSNKEIPGSFDGNYDFSKGAAVVSDLAIKDGIKCHNCYIFAGAGFGVLINVAASVSSGITFSFQVAVYGGAGYNIDLELTNLNALNIPFSGAPFSVPLVPAATTSASMTLFTGTNHYPMTKLIQ